MHIYWWIDFLFFFTEHIFLIVFIDLEMLTNFDSIIFMECTVYDGQVCIFKKNKFTSLSFAIDWYLWNALVSLRCIIDIQGVCADSCALCSKTKTFKNSYHFGWSWSNCNQWCGCQNACSKCGNQASIFWCKYI